MRACDITKKFVQGANDYAKKTNRKLKFQPDDIASIQAGDEIKHYGPESSLLGVTKGKEHSYEEGFFEVDRQSA